MLILFKCNNPECTNSIEKYFRPKSKMPLFLDCGDCGIGKMERQLGAPSSKSVQYVDNGLYSRRVEVNDDVIQKEMDKLNRE